VLRAEHPSAEGVDRGAGQAGTFRDLFPIRFEEVCHRPQRNHCVAP